MFSYIPGIENIEIMFILRILQFNLIKFTIINQTFNHLPLRCKYVYVRIVAQNDIDKCRYSWWFVCFMFYVFLLKYLQKYGKRKSMNNFNAGGFFKRIILKKSKKTDVFLKLNIGTIDTDENKYVEKWFMRKYFNKQNNRWCMFEGIFNWKVMTRKRKKKKLSENGSIHQIKKKIQSGFIRNEKPLFRRRKSHPFLLRFKNSWIY